MTPQERAEKLADAHWGYIHALILEHGAGEELAKVVGFHYRTAFAHGYKHATEDARETARAAFTPVQEEEKALEELCVNPYCTSSGDVCKGGSIGCAGFTPPPDKPSFPFTFPPALKWMGKTETEYDEKLIEEVDEVVKAEDDRHRMIELFDVVHVCESAIRTLAEKTGVDPAEAAAATVHKNKIRGYYKPQG